MKNEYTIPIYIEAQNSIFNKLEINNNLTKESIKNTIDIFLENIKEENIYKEVAIFGGSFTSLEKQEQETILETIYEYINDGKINSIRISTNPKNIDKEELKMLKKYKVQTIELSVQTSNNYILGKCKLNYSFEDIKRASKLIKRNGFNLGFQIMVGLPESTRLDELNTARDLSKLKPKIIRIYPLVVIKNSEIEKEYQEKEFMPLTLGQAVERCKELYYFFSKKKVSQIHIGYKNADLMNNVKETDIVEGPYHEAFDVLVEDSIWYDSIVEKIKKFNVKVKEVEISVNPNNTVNILGYENENAKKLKELYEVDVVLNEDEQKSVGKFDIKILKTYTDFLEETNV